MTNKHSDDEETEKRKDRPQRREFDPKQAAIFALKQQYRQLERRSLASQTSVARKDEATPTSLHSPSSRRRISFAELVHCACFPLAAISQKRMQVIKKNLSLYTQYEWVVGKMSVACSGEQIAASTNSKVMSRTTDCFDLQIRPDNSNNKQVHILLKLKSMGKKQASDSALFKGVFLHCMLGQQFKVMHFENVLDGQAQILIEQDSDTYHLITSPNAKLYLC